MCQHYVNQSLMNYAHICVIYCTWYSTCYSLFLLWVNVTTMLYFSTTESAICMTFWGVLLPQKHLSQELIWYKKTQQSVEILLNIMLSATYYCISDFFRYVSSTYSSSMLSSIICDELQPIISHSVAGIITVTVCSKLKNHK
jgi:hypothetical protein